MHTDERSALPPRALQGLPPSHLHLMAFKDARFYVCCSIAPFVSLCSQIEYISFSQIFPKPSLQTISLVLAALWPALRRGSLMCITALNKQQLQFGSVIDHWPLCAEVSLYDNEIHTVTYSRMHCLSLLFI